MSSKDSDEIRAMHTMSNNIEIVMGSETDDISKELSESLLQKYQEGLEEHMRGMNLLLIVLIYCVIISCNKFKKRRIIYGFS